MPSKRIECQGQGNLLQSGRLEDYGKQFEVMNKISFHLMEY